MKPEDSSRLIETLGKPGEGIPTLTRLGGRYIMFPLLDLFVSWDKAWEIFDKEGQKIVQLAKPLSKERLFERVLVPKLFGLEDNSRYYSVAMVLKHLHIVGEALVQRIPPLSRGEKLGH
jgi:hypothetical protein